MNQIPTLYKNYQELLLDLDILGDILSCSSVTREELKKVLFEEYKETHPAVTLAGKRYELSALVSSDYHIHYGESLELDDGDELVDFFSDGVSTVPPEGVAVNSTSGMAAGQRYDSGTPGMGDIEGYGSIYGSAVPIPDTVVHPVEVEYSVEDDAVEEIDYSLYVDDCPDGEPEYGEFFITEESVSNQEGVSFGGNEDVESTLTEQEDSEYAFDESGYEVHGPEGEIEYGEFQIYGDDYYEETEDDCSDWSYQEDVDDYSDGSCSEGDDCAYEDEFDESKYEVHGPDGEIEYGEFQIYGDDYYDEDEHDYSDGSYFDDDDYLEDDVESYGFDEADYEGYGPEGEIEYGEFQIYGDDYYEEDEDDYTDDEDDYLDGSYVDDDYEDEDGYSDGSYSEDGEDYQDGSPAEGRYEDDCSDVSYAGSEEVPVEQEIAVPPAQQFAPQNQEFRSELVHPPQQVAEAKVDRDSEPRDLREFVRKHPRCEVSFALKYFSRKEIEKYLTLGKVIKKGSKLHI